MAENTAPSRRRGRVLRKVALTLVFILLFYIAGSVAAAFIVPRIIFTRTETVAESLEAGITGYELSGREMRFKSGGNLLRGYYYGADNAKGLIVFVHGFRSGAMAHLPEIARFVSGGWSVFAFDGTGTRESEGSGTVGLPQMKYDLLCALDFIEAELPEMPVALYGHSQGAYAVASVLNDRQEIKAAVTVSGFDSPVDLMVYHARRQAGVLADLEMPFLALENYVTFGADGNERASESISSGNTPVLIISGDSDEVVPDELSIASGEISDPNARVLILPGGHADLWFTREAAKKRAEALEKLAELRKEYGEEIPEEALESFYGEIDPERLWELDEDYIAAVLSFFENAVK